MEHFSISSPFYVISLYRALPLSYSLQFPFSAPMFPACTSFVPSFPRFLSEKTSRGDQRDSRDHQQNFMRQHEQTEYDYARSDQEHSQSRSVFLLFSAGPFPFSASHIPVSSLISCRRFPSVPVEGENPAMLPRDVSDKRLR